MLSLRLVTLLLLLLPLVCPKPRPGHYLIETEDGQADHSADGDDAIDDAADSSDNGTIIEIIEIFALNFIIIRKYLYLVLTFDILKVLTPI